MGLTAAKSGLTGANSRDAERLTRACLAVPFTALSLWLIAMSPITLLPALLGLFVLCRDAPAMRYYFVAFSPRNPFPRNLPAFARWAALYASVMLAMIVLPPTLSVSARLGVWLAFVSATLLFPLVKARQRARMVWHP
ncbi:MAG: hypothetical protein AAF714_05175 [Pseudomonadota bacterium]